MEAPGQLPSLPSPKSGAAPIVNLFLLAQSIRSANLSLAIGDALDQTLVNRTLHLVAKSTNHQ